MSQLLENCTYVLFGVTGNLARTKLMPALYQLHLDKLLPEGCKIVGVGRRVASFEGWIKELKSDLAATVRGGLDEATYAQFCKTLSYCQNGIKTEKDFQDLSSFLKKPDYPKNIAFYFSLPPAVYGTVAGGLGKAGLFNQQHGWKRVVVEKPFGSNLETARALQHSFDKYLAESQVFRIDHYLGKETVQNVQVFRFANVLLEPLWNRHYIDHVQITHSETIGIGSRGIYYDQSGALRDMIQSHLLQLMSLIAMEPPVSMNAEDLRDEKVKLLRSISPIPRKAISNCSFRAQYSKATIANQSFNGYLDEPGIPDDSTTETYAALKLHIDNWRWRGVPFYLRTGKAMKEKRSMVAICFRHPPKQFFRTSQVENFKPNWLLIGIQPDETLKMEITVKKPGLDMETETISLDTCFDNEHTRGGYEGLLLDVIEGDHSLFLRSDEVDKSWQIIDPVLRYWAEQTDYIATYPAGSWGPKEAHRLFELDGQRWRHSLEPGEKD